MIPNPPCLFEQWVSKSATSLIAEAARAGAQLVVLPELLNTGYEYRDRNYALAESIDGETVTCYESTGGATRHSSGRIVAAVG